MICLLNYSNTNIRQRLGTSKLHLGPPVAYASVGSQGGVSDSVDLCLFHGLLCIAVCHL